MASVFFTQGAPLTTKTGNNRCDSYEFTYNAGAWSKGAPRSNCIVASNSTIFLESRISGNALSNISNGVTVDRPKGEVSGTICAASNCHTHSVAPFPSWAETCAGSSKGNITIVGAVTLSSGPNLSDQCWEKRNCSKQFDLDSHRHQQSLPF